MISIGWVFSIRVVFHLILSLATGRLIVLNELQIFLKYVGSVTVQKKASGLFLISPCSGINLRLD